MKENPNIYDLSTNPARLELYCNQEKYIVHFDIEDYDRISKYHWRLSKKEINIMYVQDNIKMAIKFNICQIWL